VQAVLALQLNQLSAKEKLNQKNMLTKIKKINLILNFIIFFILIKINHFQSKNFYPNFKHKKI
jgi:hypothetical protein